jgi:hypothetical protein
MLDYEVILIGFCVAFVVVEFRPRIKLFEMKPWNCLPCACGWTTLGSAIATGLGWWSVVYFFIGVCVGAIFSRIKMRYL